MSLLCTQRLSTTIRITTLPKSLNCTSTLTKPLRQLSLPLHTRYSRTFAITTARMGKDTSISKDPPKHSLYYFPKLTSEVRGFGQFRKVIHTGHYSQLVTMEIPVGGDIGNEVHMVDQVLIFTSGEGKAVVAGKEQVCRPFLCLQGNLECWCGGLRG